MLIAMLVYRMKNLHIDVYDGICKYNVKLDGKMFAFSFRLRSVLSRWENLQNESSKSNWNEKLK